MKSFKSARRASAAVLMLAGLTVFASQKQKGSPAPSAKDDAPSPDRVLHFVREKFGVVSTTKLTIASFDPSPDPNYYQTVVTIDDGKQPKQQPLSVSKDGRYLLLGDMMALYGEIGASAVQYIRDTFKVPANVNLTAGALHASKYPGFLNLTVTASNGVSSQNQDFLVTEDKKFLNLGSSVFDLSIDPRREALRTMSLKDQPVQGSAKAPVVIVEYADLECPSCARMHQYLEDQFMPKYKDKVRIVFKEFPLPLHPWGETGAIANECAYQIDPSKFLPYRTLIFQHQSEIDAVQTNASQVRDFLLNYGQQAGLDRGKLAACFDAQASKARVDEGHHEGELLSVAQTPTLFVNGKVLPGPSPDILTQAVEDALKESK
ncbi:MAG TPA: thioredoxin domain-containing protein [Terriglobia bacterium]